MSSLETTIRQSVSKEFADELAFKIMRIVRRKAEAGDNSALATIAEATARE